MSAPTPVVPPQRPAFPPDPDIGGKVQALKKLLTLPEKPDRWYRKLAEILF